MKIVCIMGKTCAGKTSIEKALGTMGFKRLVSYTTKNPRVGEIDKEDYRFVSCEQFQSLIEGKLLVEWTQHMGNYYGAPLPVGSEMYVVVVTPDGYRKFKEKYGIQVVGVYVDIDEDTAKYRNAATTENRGNLDLRIKAEKFMFNRMKSEAELVLDGKEEVRESVVKILKYLRD